VWALNHDTGRVWPGTVSCPGGGTWDVKTYPKGHRNCSSWPTPAASNSSRSRTVENQLTTSGRTSPGCTSMCPTFRLEPSKWNKIRTTGCSPSSPKTGGGRPLFSYATIVNLIRSHQDHYRTQNQSTSDEKKNIPPGIEVI